MFLILQLLSSPAKENDLWNEKMCWLFQWADEAGKKLMAFNQQAKIACLSTVKVQYI